MCVHRIPLPTSVTIASRPSYGCETSESIVLICPTTQCRGCATDWHDGQCHIPGQLPLPRQLPRRPFVDAPREVCLAELLDPIGPAVLTRDVQPGRELMRIAVVGAGGVG